jgi:hypothetical protein
MKKFRGTFPKRSSREGRTLLRRDGSDRGKKLDSGARDVYHATLLWRVGSQEFGGEDDQGRQGSRSDRTKKKPVIKEFRRDVQRKIRTF